LIPAATDKRPAEQTTHLESDSEWIPTNYSFIHGKTMNRAAFWDLIRITRPQLFISGQHLDNLAGHLSTLDPKEIASFEKHHLDLGDEAYDARLLEVLWILTGGGPGDEGWMDFTDWLILQGQKVFEQILNAPERLPELYPPGTEIYCGGLGSLARTAYEDTTGRDDFDTYYEMIHGPYQLPAAPKGAKKDPRTEPEEELEKRLRKKYPQLWKYEAQYD
jgi:hypothetical protein